MSVTIARLKRCREWPIVEMSSFTPTLILFLIIAMNDIWSHDPSEAGCIFRK
jgi:hypothetical protein